MPWMPCGRIALSALILSGLLLSSLPLTQSERLRRGGGEDGGSDQPRAATWTRATDVPPSLKAYKLPERVFYGGVASFPKRTAQADTPPAAQEPETGALDQPSSAEASDGTTTATPGQARRQAEQMPGSSSSSASAAAGAAGAGQSRAEAGSGTDTGSLSLSRSRSRLRAFLRQRWQATRQRGGGRAQAQLQKTSGSGSGSGSGSNSSEAESFAETLQVRRGKVALGFNGLDAYTMKNSGTRLYKANNDFVAPPDVSGCVGAGFIVQPVNIAIVVYDTLGRTRAGPTPTHQFLGLRPLLDARGEWQDLLSDGNCVYDKSTGRFFYSITWQNLQGRSPWDSKFNQGPLGSGMVVAVSKFKNPLLPWDYFLIPTTNTGRGGASHNDSKAPLFYPTLPSLGDYPQIGVDKYGVYVTMNQFAGSEFSSIQYVGQNIYALGKQHLFRRRPFLALRFAMPLSWLNGLAGAIGFIIPSRATADWGVPFNTLNGGTIYFASLIPTRALGVWALTGTASLNRGWPHATSLHMTVVKTPAYAFAPEGVEQKWGPKPLAKKLGYSFQLRLRTNSNSGSAITVSTAFVFGQLYVAWTVGLGGTRSAAAVAKVVPTLSLLPGGARKLSAALKVFKFFRVPGQSIVFPAINFNRRNLGLLSFCISGKLFFPSPGYLVLNAGLVPIGGVRVPILGKLPLESTDGYETSFFSTATRYGDWQTVTMDEAGNAWAFIEYISGKHAIPANKRWDNWATFVFKVSL